MPGRSPSERSLERETRRRADGGPPQRRAGSRRGQARPDGPAPGSTASAGDHGHHAHAFGPEADARRIAAALGLVVALLCGEAVAGFLGHSLALLADAGHLLTDAAALLAAIVAARLAVRPPAGPWTFGFRRAEILSAAVNGVTLVAVGLAIAVEAVGRLVHPTAVSGPVVLGVASAGAAVDLLATALLARADRSNLNVRGVATHIATDLLAFVGTALAGLVVTLTGYRRADPIASLVVVALMAAAAWPLLRDSGRILLEAAPAQVDLDLVREHLLAADHVVGVHDLHLWTVGSGAQTLSVHVVVEDHCFETGHAPQLLDHLQACLGDHFDVEHATFQLEPASHATHEPGTHG